MSLLSRLAGLPASLKESWKKTFGDVDVALDDETTDAAPTGGVVSSRPALTLPQAWGIVGVVPGATLDEVRAAARARAQALHPRVADREAAGRDEEAQRALEQLIAASELLEEHLLPAVRGSAPAPGGTSTAAAKTTMTTPVAARAGRVRATPRTSDRTPSG